MVPGGDGSNFTQPGFANGYTSVDGDRVAFHGNGGGAPSAGVYVFDTNSSSYPAIIGGTDETFFPNGSCCVHPYNLSAPKLEGTTVTFSACANGCFDDGILTTATGPLTALVDSSEPIPDQPPFMFPLGAAPISADSGEVVWTQNSDISIQAGAYKLVGGSVEKIFDTSTSVPGGLPSSGAPTTFSNGFSKISFENGSAAWAQSFGSAIDGLYTDIGGQLIRVLGVSDGLDGKVMNGLHSKSGQALSAGNFVFRATFTDGSQGIYYATITPPGVPAVSGYGQIALVVLIVLPALGILGRVDWKCRLSDRIG